MRIRSPQTAAPARPAHLPVVVIVLFILCVLLTSCATAVEPQGTPSPLRPSPQLGRGDGGEGAAQLPTATAQP
ncbi:MAG: hypothetical protein HYR71_05725, partial [Chloroflexi bacterium]|nr:hypothetical protein [Chloroflexota bacterium]